MAWVQVAPQSGSRAIVYDTIVYGGELYGGSSGDGALLKWNGSNAWTVAAPQLGSNTGVYSLGIYNGALYGIVGTAGAGRIALFTGSAWSVTTPSQPSNSDIRFFIPALRRLFVVSGSLPDLDEYVGTSSLTMRSAALLSSGSPLCGVSYQNLIWIGTDAGVLASIGMNGGSSSGWTVAATYTSAPITALCVHNGVLYAGTGDGNLLRWTGSALVAAAATIQDGPAITAMVSYNGMLYLGLSRSS